MGDEVFAGTINGAGALILRVHQPPESSLIQRVIRFVVLMADRLEKLTAAIRLGRRVTQVVTQNIGFALCSIGLLLVANFTIGISLPLGVIGHEGSTILVILSGLRLLRNNTN